MVFKDTRFAALTGPDLVTLSSPRASTFHPTNDRNNDLDKAGDPARIADLAAVRQHFEVKWVAWNMRLSC